MMSMNYKYSGRSVKLTQGGWAVSRKPIGCPTTRQENTDLADLNGFNGGVEDAFHLKAWLAEILEQPHI